MHKQMKNIAVITGGYYPDMSPISAVVDKYIQQLKGDYIFHVITKPSRIDFQPLRDPYVKVYYVSTLLYRCRLKLDERYKKSSSFLIKLIIQLFRIRTLLLTFLLDDNFEHWEVEKEFAELEKINKKIKIDSIISVSGYSTNPHFAALNFIKKYPSVKWFTFITDPISFHNSNFDLPYLCSKKRLQRKRYNKELQIYNNADYNIFLENLYYDAIEKFNQPKDKTIHFRLVLENMQSDFCSGESKPGKETSLVYAGALYKDIRNPEYMLSVLSEINGIRTDLFARTNQCLDVIKKYESDNIRLHGGVGLHEYKRMICNDYDILLNIGNNCDNQVPSKMLELLSSGRPIINFYYYRDSQYEMIEKYPLGLNIGRDDIDAVKKVDLFCREMKGKQLPFDEVEKLFPENSLKNQKEILISLINR